MVDDEDCRSGSEEESAFSPKTAVEEDLVALCRRLNKLGARYLVIGGYAIIHAGYPRFTAGLDILMDTAPEQRSENLYGASSLKDRAVGQLEPGDISKYAVVRVADEIVVDVMKSACGIDYEEASKEVIFRKIGDVEVHSSRPRLLWRMKKNPPRCWRFVLPAKVVRSRRRISPGIVQVCSERKFCAVSSALRPNPAGRSSLCLSAASGIGHRDSTAHPSLRPGTASLHAIRHPWAARFVAVNPSAPSVTDADPEKPVSDE